MNLISHLNDFVTIDFVDWSQNIFRFYIINHLKSFANLCIDFRNEFRVSFKKFDNLHEKKVFYNNKCLAICIEILMLGHVISP